MITTVIAAGIGEGATDGVIAGTGAGGRRAGR